VRLDLLNASLQHETHARNFDLESLNLMLDRVHGLFGSSICHCVRRIIKVHSHSIQTRHLLSPIYTSAVVTRLRSNLRLMWNGL